MSGASSDTPLDVDEWLLKMPRIKKAVQDDMIATQKSVDEEVHKLEGNINRRIIEIDEENKRLNQELLAMKMLEGELRQKKYITDAIMSKTTKVQNRNKQDEAQINAIKSHRQKAESRLRKVEEGLNSLGNMWSESTVTARKVSKRVADNNLCFEDAQKRHRGPDSAEDNMLRPSQTTTFSEVYKSGKTLQEMVKCPDTNKYFVLTCIEHSVDFGIPAYENAIEHARDHHHGVNLTPQEVIDNFGVPVLGCRSWHFTRNNGTCRKNQEKITAEEQAAESENWGWGDYPWGNTDLV